MRIVSLLPSATEIVWALGLTDDLVGVTHECDYPPGVERLPRVTRTRVPDRATSRDIDRVVRSRPDARAALYTLDEPVLRALAPDLIITQALCDVCAVAEDDVRAAARALPGECAIVDLTPRTLDGVLDAIRQVAAAAGIDDRAERVVGALAARIAAVAARSAALAHRPRVALLEWLDPPFSCGHWSPELVHLAGGIEVLGRSGEPSRTLEWRELAAEAPDVVVAACCGFGVERTLADLPAMEAAPGWAHVPAAVSGRVYVVDGSHYFSRPGPRLVDSLEILAHALHPDVHPLPAGLPAPVRAARGCGGAERDAAAVSA
jgi:iron complex transport system substrate-binding protein